MGIFDKTAASLGGGGLNLFGNSPLGQIGNAVAEQGLQYAKAKVATKNLPFFNAAENLLRGDVMGAFNSVVNPQVIGMLLSRNRKNLPRWQQISPLTAHLSMEELQRIVMASHNMEQARKNLWLINVSDYSSNALMGSLGSALGNIAGNAMTGLAGKSNLFKSYANEMGSLASMAVKTAIAANPITSGLNEMGGGITSNYNLLATGLSYTPISIEGDQHNIGAAIVGGAKSAQRAEISLTTMDTEDGFIKRWFKNKASAAIHPDGTVGVLADSLIQIRILHGFVSDNTNRGGFEETLICRPVSVDYEFDRREDAMQEFTLRFEQTDTFF